MVKVKRSYPAPASLAVEANKKDGSYNGKDVVERLKEDFHDKCYICELKNLQDPEVEHLLPHKSGAFSERKFDWNNLFWSCGHCNRVKNSGKYDEGIVDCCKQDPEKLLQFSLENDDIHVSAINPDDKQSVLTAMLIYETFNKRNTGIREAACENRVQALIGSMNVMYRNLEKYKSFPDSPVYKRMMRAILRRDSEFAAFKRAYIRDNISEYPGLASYVSLD